MLLAVCHSEETGWIEVDDLSRLSDLRVEAGNLLWAEADIATLNEGEMALIAEEFGLHPFAVEDAVRTRQRPKLEVFDEHLFVVFHELDETEQSHLEALQISCFIGDRFLISLHEGAARIIDEAKKRWADAGRLKAGPAYLLHTLLDALVDDFEDIVTRLEDEIEQLEEIALETPTAPIQRELYSVKQRIARLRRYALPLGRVLDSIDAASADAGFPIETRELFRNVHDHIQRASDQIRNVDDLTEAVLDLRRSEQATALNDVTKRLTGWAAIIAVPTFIASVYGMNFSLVPADGQLFGFWFALVLMGASGLVLYSYFKKRNWI